jgi:hypothetical protein
MAGNAQQDRHIEIDRGLPATLHFCASAMQKRARVYPRRLTREHHVFFCPDVDALAIWTGNLWAFPARSFE